MMLVGPPNKQKMLSFPPILQVGVKERESTWEEEMGEMMIEKGEHGERMLRNKES